MKVDIQTGIEAVLQSKKKLYPSHVNRISGLDDPCLRRLYYSRHDWDKANETSTFLQGIFETGKTLEPKIEQIVIEVGLASTPRWRMVGRQTPTHDALFKEHQISGTTDEFLQIETGDDMWETVGAIDVKTMSPNIYPRITDYASLSRYPWTKKYRGQAMLYSLGHNLDRCFLLLVNKNNLYEMKIIEFEVDMGYCDELLAKAKAVNKAIASETPPPQIVDAGECSKCRFLSHCCPDISTGGNLEMIDNDELEAILDQMAELEEHHDQYKDLAKTLDAMLYKGKDIACGNWLVTWKEIVKNFKAQPAKEGFTRTEYHKTIIRTGANNGTD